MTRICFVVGSPTEALIDVALASHLQAAGHTVHCVTYHPEAQVVVAHSNLPVTHLPAHLPDAPLPSDAALATLDTQYQDPGLSLMVNSDVLLRRGSYQNGLEIIVNHIHFWEDFFEKNQPELLLMYVTAYRVGRTAYAVARSRRVPHLIIQTGVAQGLFSLCDKNEDWIWSELLNALQHDTPLPLTPEMQAQVQDLVSQVSTFKDMTKPPRSSLKSFAKLTLRNLITPATSIEWNEWDKARQRTQWWNLPVSRLRYDTVRNDEKFVFFPLHAPWDAQILTRNPLYYNQFELVRQVALSLPVGYFLYVKEHPYNVGGEPLHQLRAIQKIHNVRVIDPCVNSKSLIQKSRAVFVINGTAGWEAFLFKRSVIVAGAPFYGYSDLVYPVQRFNELPDMMRLAVTEGTGRYEANFERWIRFIYHALNTCYAGNPWGYKTFWGGDVPTELTDDNVVQVATAIDNKIKRMTGKV